MNALDFKSDLQKALNERRFTQADLSRKSGISQGAISKMLNAKKDLRFSTVLALWPILYGAPFPATHVSCEKILEGTDV